MNDMVGHGALIHAEDYVRVRNRPEWGTGEVLKVAQNLGVYQAKILFKTSSGERVETVPLEWLEKASDLWQRLASGDFDDPLDHDDKHRCRGRDRDRKNALTGLRAKTSSGIAPLSASAHRWCWKCGLK